MDFFNNNVLSPLRSEGNGMMLSFVVVVALVAIFTLSYSMFNGKHGFPCFCTKCEQQIVEAAENGDPEAQRALAQLLNDWKLKEGQLSTGTNIPAFNLVLLVVVIGALGFILTRVFQGGRRAQLDRFTQPLFTGQRA